VKLLEYKANFFGAETRQPSFIEARNVGAVHNRPAGSG
jgi:hypothetical protein